MFLWLCIWKIDTSSSGAIEGKEALIQSPLEARWGKKGGSLAKEVCTFLPSQPMTNTNCEKRQTLRKLSHLAKGDRESIISLGSLEKQQWQPSICASPIASGRAGIAHQTLLLSEPAGCNHSSFLEWPGKHHQPVA